MGHHAKSRNGALPLYGVVAVDAVDAGHGEVDRLRLPVPESHVSLAGPRLRGVVHVADSTEVRAVEVRRSARANHEGI